ncbi:clarin-3 [Hyperolius riggenbachi]|uniref:clarin-3 n=1 Tax=Hyperolius riggenbachi TaxID=752182 RepID=UPI0035A33323
MPSKQKTLLFFAGFVSSLGSFAIICTCLGTQEWVFSKVQFSSTPTSTGNYSGIASVELGLFKGGYQKDITEGVGLGTPWTSADVFDVLNSTTIKVSHIIVIFFLVAALISCFLGLATTCLNSVSNPYLTFLGPLGVYVWSSINGILVLLAMIVYAINIEVNKLPRELVKAMDMGSDEFSSSQNTYGYSYWLLLLSIFLSMCTIGVIYYYQHIRYSQQKQQERPMESASKDVILF